MPGIPDLSPQHTCDCYDCDGGRMEDRCIFAELLEGIFHVADDPETTMSEVVSAVNKARQELEQQEQINQKANEGEDDDGEADSDDR